MKTLWIGCSQSAGSYSKQGQFDNVTGPGIPEFISKQLGEYNQWKIIATPGEGIIRHSQIISALIETNVISRFQNIILQLTVEPRLASWSMDHERNYINYILDYLDNDDHTAFRPNDHNHPGQFILNTVGLHYQHKSHFPSNEGKSILLDRCEKIVEPMKIDDGQLEYTVRNCHNYIISRLKDLGKNIYTFYYMKKEDSLRNNEFDLLNNKELFDPLDYKAEVDFIKATNHPMQPIIKSLSNTLLDALKKHGYK